MAKHKTVCIFAHPDDEAFGPSGTIAKYAEEGEVFLICVTNGNDKTRKDNSGLSEIRKQELVSSSNTLGVKKVYFLDFEDGELRNNIYHQVSDKIQNILDKIKPDTLITYEPKGVSGHLDHIFCSMVTSYLYRENKYVKKLLLYCLPKIRSSLMKNYFIYFPDGYEKKEVQEIVDVSKYWNLKLKAVKCHKSQKKDVVRILAIMKLQKYLKFFPKEEYFLVQKRGL